MINLLLESMLHLYSFGLITLFFTSRINSTIKIDEYVEALRTSNALEILSQHPLICAIGILSSLYLSISHGN